MMSRGFVHLHVHSQYSLLQGAAQIEDLIARAQGFGMPAMALTDRHNLFGVIDFYQQAQRAGVRPILGCELLLAPSAVTGTYPSHLTVLCKSQQGYRNLCQLLSRAYIEAPPPQKGTPNLWRHAVTPELLERYASGLIVLSGNLRGEIPRLLLEGETSALVAKIDWYRTRFGEDFYFEVQDHGLPEEVQVSSRLLELSARMSIRAVATQDVHYLSGDTATETAANAEAQEILQCIEQGRQLDFDRPRSLVPHNYALLSAEAMYERFSHAPEICEESLAIAEKCRVEFAFKDAQGRAIYHLPKFRPEGVSADDTTFESITFFRSQARAGLATRVLEIDEARRVAQQPALSAEETAAYRERLEQELAMIERTGFADYFLIVADFINWAKRNAVPVGPGRGSGAGSLVAYSLGITDVDPIAFKLLFERFINPERISMPDFDVDFCQDRRSLVIDYVTQKYGAANVSQIITFGKLQARAVIKDVGRVLGLSFAETDQITKLLPMELGITLDDAIAREPRLVEKMETEPRVAQVMRYARKLEGLSRNAGVHAAGVIITERPLVEYCPLYVGKDGAVVTQLDKDAAEAIGLVKFDFLGLKTLTVIDHAVRLAREHSPGAEGLRLDRIGYGDARVYELISSGDTDGVFQVESSGMKDLCSRLQPGSIEDLTAINALYRPGPLGSGMVDDFIERKHGRKPISYEVPELESILKETYGVILYQEQVMQIARELAGYSLGQADLLRRAMGKKKPEEMAKHRELFVGGATQRGLARAQAEWLFDLMAKFAEYGFNKSHSAAYAVLTYQTAYLKAHHPAEFMAALMTTEMSDTDKLAKYIADARAHGLSVLAPDVNRSERKFGVEAGPKGERAVRFGLEAIKGVGSIAVDEILAMRAQKPFASVLDFCSRVSSRKANKKVLESLIQAGAFDAIAEANRASLSASLEGLLEYAGAEQEERELGQSSLFEAMGSAEIKLQPAASSVIQSVPEWPRARQLLLEKQTVGFYVSGHPMETWQRICEDWLKWSIPKVHEFAAARAESKQPEPEPQFEGGRFRRSRPSARLGAMVAEIREVMTKKGARMAFVQLEDLTGRIETVVFPEAYTASQELLRRAMAEAEPLLVTAEIEMGEEAPKLLLSQVEWLKDAHGGRVQQVLITLPAEQAEPGQLRALKQELLAHAGRTPVKIEFAGAHFKTALEVGRELAVEASPVFVERVNRIFGAQVVRLS